MDFQEWASLFFEQIKNTHLLEWIAVGFGVSEVLLAKKNNIWLYPTGIISIVLGMYLLFGARLYAEILLSMYYLAMSIYGWAIWKKRKTEGAQQVSYTTKRELSIAFLISGIGFFILYFALKNMPEKTVYIKFIDANVNFIKSDVPMADAFVSSFAWAGMWLLARRKIENWIFLNISNIVAIPLLFHKKLVLMSCLTTFLFVVAIFGFLDWKKIYKHSKIHQPL